MCLFGHRWWPVAARNYVDTSWHMKAASCVVTCRCSRCGKLKVDRLYASGFLSLEELQQQPRRAAVLRLVGKR